MQYGGKNSDSEVGTASLEVSALNLDRAELKAI